MVSIILCIAAFAFSYVAARRSLVTGLAVVTLVGYFYGILRANLPEAGSHFIFDAGVGGLYLAQFAGGVGRSGGRSQQVLRIWLGFLMGWPFLLFFVPVQDYAVQLVGLRGNIFLLPFILLGARLRGEDLRKLALVFAVLNLLAFSFACAEYVGGVERFYPQNQVTELIYKSVVDENYDNPDRSTALRIPSTFTGAHAYAGTMVLTFGFLLGAWVQKNWRERWQRHLLLAAMLASIIGIFMAAARSPVVILVIMIGGVVAAGRLQKQAWALLLAMMLGVGWIVSSEARLQRFLTLADVDFVSERVYWSANESFLELAVEYPMGNGLGGGGTSMPYFLLGSVEPPTAYMENEYARIVLEQGVIGLCLWLGFILWVFSRRTTHPRDPWYLGKRLLWFACASYFITGIIGKGLLTSIPGTALLLLSVGWVAVRQPRAAVELAETEARRDDPLPQQLVRHYG